MRRALLLAILLLAAPAVAQWDEIQNGWSEIQTSSASPLTTKGDVFGFSTTNARIPIGTNGFVLTADSTQALGLKWAAVTATAPGSDTQVVFNDGGSLGANAGLTFQKASAALSGTGPWTLTPTSDIVPLTTRAFSSGTSYIQQNQDSSNNVLSGWTHAGEPFLLAGKGAGKVLTSDANGVGTWAAAAGGVTNSAGANVVTKSDGTNLVASSVTDNGTTLTLGNAGVTVTEATGVLAAPAATFSATAATVPLTVSNGSQAVSPLLVKDNTTTKFAVNDNGLTEISLLQADMPTDGSKGALTVTTTLPASPSAAVSGIQATVTSAGSATQDQYGLRLTLAAGYTGNQESNGIRAINNSAGTGAGDFISSNVGNFGGEFVMSSSANNAHNVGLYGAVANGGTGTAKSFALIGKALSGSTAVGVYGLAAGGTIRTGGAFTLTNTGLPTFASTALLADNADVAAPIFLARDNGTTVFSVEDNGPVKWTQATGASTMTVGSNQEALTLSVGGAATNTAGNLAPALSRIKAITYRVTTTITTAASYTVTITGGAAWKDMALASTTITNLTAGQTGVLVPGTFGDDFNAAATTLTVTCNTTPGAGAIRFTVWYETYAAPSS